MAENCRKLFNSFALNTTNTQNGLKMRFKKELIPEYIFFIFLVGFTAFVRFRLSDMAMERDEGEYAYAAADILRGGIPYLDFYNMKLPGVYLFYATIFFFFGHSMQAVRLVVLAMTFANSFFILKISEKWFNERTGWLSAGVYLLASVSTRAQGLVSNCEHFVLLFFLMSLMALLGRYYFLAGLSAALCVMMKQQGIVLLGFNVVYFCFDIFQNRKAMSIIKPCFRLLAGFLIPFTLFVLWLWQQGALSSCRFFVVDYARAYTGLNKATPFNFAPFLFIINQNEWFWKEAILGFLVCFSYLFFKNKNVFNNPHSSVFTIVFATLSYISVLPGWYYRPHYFLYVHPALALLAGSGLAWFYAMCQDKVSKMVYIMLLTVSLLTSIYDQYPYIGKYKNGEFINLLYGYDYFNEMREIGSVIRLNAKSDDKIGQVANEPQLMFYAGLKSASGYMYNYPFYEKQPYATQMLEQFFSEMDKNKPRWYIKNITDAKWLNDNKIKMDSWVTQFEKDYILRGVVSGKNEWEKTIHWNVSKIDTVKGWIPAFLIFERKDSAAPQLLIVEK